jgi:hypothetical protein
MALLNTGDSLYTRKLRSCESPRISKTHKTGNYNNLHFYVKLEPEFFYASLVICITFPDKPGEGSTL